jgi:hypothetical protein
VNVEAFDVLLIYTRDQVVKCWLRHLKMIQNFSGDVSPSVKSVFPGSKFLITVRYLKPLAYDFT